MKIIMVPYWLDKVVQKENRSLSSLKDETFLANTLSREDIAFYIYINKNLAKFSAELAETFQTHGDADVLGLSDQFIQESDHESLRYRFQQETFTALFFGSLADPAKDHYFEDRYIVKMVDMDTYAIVPKKGTGDTYIGMIDYLLYLLNQRMSFDQLAKTPLFSHYMHAI